MLAPAFVACPRFVYRMKEPPSYYVVEALNDRYGVGRWIHDPDLAEMPTPTVRLGLFFGQSVDVEEAEVVTQRILEALGIPEEFLRGWPLSGTVLP